MKNYPKRWLFYYRLLRAKSEYSDPYMQPHGRLKAAIKAIQGAFGSRVYLSPLRWFYVGKPFCG